MIQKNIFKNHASVLSTLVVLTLFSIATQLSFFAIHYSANELVDSLVNSSLATGIFHAVVLLPIIGFLFIQIFSYIILIAWLWFITISSGELFKLSSFSTYLLGIALWSTSWLALLSLNHYFFPDSFFAQSLNFSHWLMYATSAALIFFTLLAYINLVWHKRHFLIGGSLLTLALVFFALTIYDKIARPLTANKSTSQSQPNIIIIGLDSLRPDFIHYFGHPTIHTPTIDNFLKSAVIFIDAYTPLARTFPSWMSILTAKSPGHSQALNNLIEPQLIYHNDTLAKRLQQAGYETIYATDEKRFSNITKEYGFDRVIGPSMGLNDFILGGLNDFPLTNLLINTAAGRFLFPYNFGNRAAAITYNPDQFLKLVKLGLANRPDKPLFLAIHFCLSHWPYTWAQDNQPKTISYSDKYLSSVEGVDKQLGQFMGMLQKNGLLKNTLIILLSDHGTTLGLPNDRLITEKNYQGLADRIKWPARYPLSNSSDLVINTSYGQGTDVLSLKQYKVLLAAKGFGVETVPQQIHLRSSLLDIAPSILDFLHLAPMTSVDGISFNSILFKKYRPRLTTASRHFFMETGFSMSDIETSDISIINVVHNAINAYQIDPKTGLLFFTPAAESALISDKQYAVLMGDWLLARYPASPREKLVPKDGMLVMKSYIQPAYFVLVNIRTGKWTIGTNTALAQSAPILELLSQLNF